LILDGQQIGWLGELHPLVVEAYDIQREWPVIAAELDAEAIMARIQERHFVEPVPVFPAVLEDIAVIVDQGVPEGDVAAVIRSAGGPLLRSVELFDVYEGESIPAGKKSLAYHLTFRSPGKTLTDKEARKNRERIVKQLRHQFGAQLRDA